jgi:hypothetical protein
VSLGCSYTGSGDIGALQSFIGKRIRSTAGTTLGFDYPASSDALGLPPKTNSKKSINNAFDNQDRV